MSGCTSRTCNPVEISPGSPGLIPGDERVSWQTWNLGTLELRYWSCILCPTLAAGAFRLGGLHRCVWSCCLARRLLGCCRLPILPVGWGRRHRYFLLESREINLLLPQSGQIIIQIQERVPIASFEDWIRGLKVTHHLHRARLPHGRIYQWTAVVLRL